MKKIISNQNHRAKSSNPYYDLLFIMGESLDVTDITAEKLLKNNDLYFEVNDNIDKERSKSSFKKLPPIGK